MPTAGSECGSLAPALRPAIHGKRDACPTCGMGSPKPAPHRNRHDAVALRDYSRFGSRFSFGGPSIFFLSSARAFGTFGLLLPCMRFSPLTSVNVSVHS